jgi:AraC-like DNA-binding protein
MLLLALTSLRAVQAHDDLARLVLEGDLSSALRLGCDRFERVTGADSVQQRALLGQLLGRVMLACGREEEAEELFQRQLKVYECVSRHMVRWHGSLDQGALLLHLNRPARAVECFNAVADDRRAPVDVRIEAMVGVAVAMHRNGDGRAALQALDVARDLSVSLPDGRIGQLVDCLALEFSMLQRERASEVLDDHALCAVYSDNAGDLVENDVLWQQLGAAASAFSASAPVIALRMQYLQHLLAQACTGAAAIAHVNDGLSWLRDRRIAGFEVPARIEAALMLIARGALRGAADVLAQLTFNEQQVNRSRYAQELQYCLAKMYQHQGRHADALRLYRHHTQHVVQALKSNAASGKTPNFLQQAQEAGQGDAARGRLPLRYRRAYQYVMDHLSDENLSVRQIAAHVGVTERALQLAFRAHLGMTPAELIRTRRMERIQGDLREHGGRDGVLEVASRWGITNRSTLVHNYRTQFDETPTQTLRGGADVWKH